MRWFFALALGGCSFSLELEGPPAYVAPPPPDLTPAEAGGGDGLMPVAFDAGLDQGPAPTTAEVQAPGGSTVLRHPGGQGALEPIAVPPDGRVAVEVVAGDALTVVISDFIDGRDQTWLITLAGVEPGDVLPVAHPAPASQLMTSVQVRLAQPLPGAGGYVVSNGCVELRCEGQSCAPWFEGRERSIAVTDRCLGAGGRVRSLAVARDDEGEPLAWAEAENDVGAENARSQTAFGDWQLAWRPIALRLMTTAERVAVFGRPFRGVAFGIGPVHRQRVEAGLETTISVPEGFAPELEIGVDLLHEGVEAARDRPARAWRSFLRDPLPAALDIDLDATVPGLPGDVTLWVDDLGAQPAITWLPAGAAGDLARVELQWEKNGRLITWIFFGSAMLGEARFPELPEFQSSLRPPPGTEGTYAQLTLVRCDGVNDLRAHRRRPCPLFGAGNTPETGRTVSWSSALAHLPPPPPDMAIPDMAIVDAGVVDAAANPADAQ